jgi:predicted CXXCH cytochrome family protein
MAVPQHLPLDQGRMTCITCHDDRAASHAQARINHTALLRNSLDSDVLCSQCHDSTQQTRLDQHGSSLGQAHLHRLGQTHHDSPPKPAAFDEQTQACLSCHDGVMSRDVAVMGLRADTFATEHPIGVRGAPSTDPRVRLFDQRVGCNSCHSPYSTEASLLVMSNHRSQLCLSCHGD